MTTPAPVTSRKRRFFRWVRYLLTVLVGLLLALVCAGAIYEAIASRRERRQFHPPGRLVDIGGYRLHLYCLGEGSPTVILEGAEIHGCPGTKCSHEPLHSPGFVPTTGQDSAGVIPVPGQVNGCRKHD